MMRPACAWKNIAISLRTWACSFSPLVCRKADGGDCAFAVVDWNRKSIPNAEPGGFFKEFALQLGPSSRSEPKTPPKGSSIAGGLADHRIEAFVVAPQIMCCPGRRRRLASGNLRVYEGC